MKNIIYLSVFAALIFWSVGCKKNKETTNTSCTGAHCTGYNSSTENVNTIPKSLNTRNLGSTSSTHPSSFFLYQYLPPVGDQGQYGTCIAWSSGYYTKTALEAITNNYNSSQLALASNEMSPKDLYTAIPDASKGANCDGTNFDAALTVMQTRGVATLQTIPYANLGSCAQSTVDPNGTADAANHKISTYRALADASTADYITDVKQNISSNVPVLVGIGVGNGFQNWVGSGVMTAGFDPCGGGGTCGGHAQTIVGYDDSKGAGGAFRVVNSWNTTWGDNGFYWVDYNFMFNTLIQKDNSGNPCIFVASNGASDTTHPINPTSGIDLASWVEEDMNTGTPGSPTREVIFDIYNIGTATAPASADWGLYYVYYNAYNANDYGVIFYDAFNTSIAVNTDQCNSTGDSCIINFDIPAGTDLAYDAFGTSTLYQNYLMPNITGYYYLILVADAGQVLGDINYSNNIFYTSDLPTSFQNGYYGKNGTPAATVSYTNNLKPTRELLTKSSFNTAVNSAHPNAYTSKEILGFLKKQKASGELDAKLRAFNAANPDPGFRGGLAGK